MFRLEEIAGELRDVVATLEPATYDGRDAALLTEVAAAGEKLFAAAKVLFARRAAQTRGWAARSHAATPEQWLANVSGCSEGSARDALATANRVAELPVTEAKLRDGKLSLTQASLVSQGATLDPDAEPKLLRVADRGEIRNLRAEKERVVAAATDALEPLRRRAFERGRTGGPRESQDAYRFDALVALAQGDGSDAGDAATTRVRVDISPLLTGKTEPGDVCEIPGVGPVPVSFARRVLVHGLLELVLHDGQDVRAVVTKTRHAAAGSPHAERLVEEARHAPNPRTAV